MTIERVVFAVAGLFIMVSLALGVQFLGMTTDAQGGMVPNPNPLYHHYYWLGFTAFVGFNLFQTAFTGLCPMFFILKKLGVKSSAEKALAQK